MWGGTMPPIPSCENCGRKMKQPFGHKIEMDEAPSVEGKIQELARIHAEGLDYLAKK
jgi:hypothetical protein